MGTLNIRTCNALRRPLEDEVDVFVESTQTGATVSSLRAVPGDAAIRVEQLTERQTYLVKVFPRRHRPVAQFATAGPDTDPSAVVLHCPLHPDRVRAATFPAYAGVPAALRHVLEVSMMDGAAGPGQALYDALGNTQKAALFNLFTKMSGVTLAGGTTVWSLVERLSAIRNDRVFADAVPELRDLVHASVDTGLFRPVSSALHDPPPGFAGAGSFKTAEPYGNLQLTFFLGASRPTRYKVDADIDDAVGLGHAFQVIRNFVTQESTHPYDIHEILVFHQQSALPYVLA